MVPMEKFPKLRAWMKVMAETDIAQKAGIPEELFGGLMFEYATGAERHYDVGVNE